VLIIFLLENASCTADSKAGRSPDLLLSPGGDGCAVPENQAGCCFTQQVGQFAASLCCILAKPQQHTCYVLLTLGVDIHTAPVEVGVDIWWLAAT
jgi:hypothetical protein